ncbi:PAS domain S-box protein [Bacillota bacterium LX-D]|nr:PAS domain S-box protein [Bacillota bacterium LX-D]
MENELKSQEELLNELQEELRELKEKYNLLADEKMVLTEKIASLEKSEKHWELEIAQRKQAEKRAIKLGDYYSTLFNYFPGLVWISGPDHKTHYFNRDWLAFTGKTLEQQINSQWMQGVHPKERDAVAQIMWEAMHNRKPFDLEFRLRRSDGKYRWINSHGRPYYDLENNFGGYICSCYDITNRKNIEKRLRQSEERFSKAYQCSPNLMCILTYEDGSFLSVNETFERVTGYRFYELLARNPAEVGLLDREFLTQSLQMLHKKGTYQNFEYNICTKNGEVLTVLASAEQITLNGQKCFLLVVNDITEHKKMEKEMARLDRLYLIGEMAACIGHEVRNPLTTVRGFLQMLGRKNECQQLTNYYDLMIEELDRANSIITEFLSLAKNKVVEKKVSNLNTVLEALKPLIQANALEKDMNVALDLGNLPDFSLDEKEIRQLILNLVTNGLEAMEPGNSLLIKTYAQNGEVILAVQNHGPKIPADILEKLGTPFFTTKEKGTGLGLAVCFSIASRHNATIKVDTNTDFTTFFVHFKI